MEKLITFAVPCYNSAAYMDHCVESLLAAGPEAEIILVDDGSTRDDTPAKCDAWAQRHPDIIRVIHQENGGHGEGVNQGIRHASGLYYKVVDSDDWLDAGALEQVMERLRRFAKLPAPVDMVVSNYVYEHTAEGTQKVVRYQNVFPAERILSWNEIHHFRTSQYLLMHSVIYRTQLLRDCGLELPKHTFYVDNLFVYQPLPYVKSLYYINADLYRYFIGRADQSVNESVMAGRIDQQVRVTELMIAAHDVRSIKASQPKLGRYMLSYLSMMMTISSIFAVLANTPESLGMRTRLWELLRQKDPALYRRCRYRLTNLGTNIPGYQGRKLSVTLYRLVRKIYKFN
ncbi:MAG TPA: glycosyltransferase family 2 protein [Candidatus Enterenecus merdae]|nr:glycosyltransferase family 2 protein [Candidatus Enterenecus merdae]